MTDHGHAAARYATCRIPRTPWGAAAWWLRFRIWERVCDVYYRLRPPREVPEFIGRQVRATGTGTAALRFMTAGDMGVVLRSEASGRQRLYHIQFDRHEVFAPLPTPEFELFPNA